jgi:hypothetical protein
MGQEELAELKKQTRVMANKQAGHAVVGAILIYPIIMAPLVSYFGWTDLAFTRWGLIVFFAGWVAAATGAYWMTYWDITKDRP